MPDLTQPTAQPGSTTHQPPVNPGTQGLAPTNSPVPKTDSSTTTASPQRPPGHQDTSAKARTPRSYLGAFLYPLCITCLIVFISLITWQADYLEWPLAQLSPTSGILLLSFLSKFTDWGMSIASEEAWSNLQWGPILQRGGNLLTFLVMGSKFGGWCKVLVYRDGAAPAGGSWAPMWRWRSRPATRVPAQVKNNKLIAWISRCKGRLVAWVCRISLGGPRFWSIIRILFWVALQFPGIIIMSIVENRTAYEPSGFARVAGGMGIFDPNIAILTPAVPMIGNYVLRLVQDPTLSIAVDPVSEECKSDDKCSSYLLSGGLDTVTPIPFAKLPSDPLTAFVMKNVPSYQIDARVVSGDESIPWKSGNPECLKYGVNFPFLFCMLQTRPDEVIAGFQSCGYSVSGDCTKLTLYPIAVALRIFRRNARVVADRRTSVILEANDMSPAVPQNITRSQFTAAIKNLLCGGPDTATVLSGYCDENMPNAMLTDQLGNLLFFTTTYGYLKTPQTMVNIFATSLFLFNPVFLAQLGSGPLFDDTLPGLPRENYFPGSSASPVEYSAPKGWTVLAFIVSAAILIMLIWLILVVAVLYKPAKTSSFQLVDDFKVRPGASGLSGDLGSLVGGKTDRQVIKMAQGVHVELDTGAGRKPGERVNYTW